jgi:hypothetical protein
MSYPLALACASKDSKIFGGIDKKANQLPLVLDGNVGVIAVAWWGRPFTFLRKRKAAATTYKSLLGKAK